MAMALLRLTEVQGCLCGLPPRLGRAASLGALSPSFRTFRISQPFRGFSEFFGVFRGLVYAFPSSTPFLARFLRLLGLSGFFRAFCGLSLLLGLPGASALFLPLPSFPVFSFLFLRLRRLSSSRAFLHGSSFCKGATGFPPFPARARGCRAYHSVSTGEKGIIRLMLDGCQPCRGVAGPRVSASPPEKKIKDISS